MSSRNNDNTLTDAQKATVEGLDRAGFHWNYGKPCECGAEFITTTKTVGYSDFVTYDHTCHECGNEFGTYIEG